MAGGALRLVHTLKAVLLQQVLFSGLMSHLLASLVHSVFVTLGKAGAALHRPNHRLEVTSSVMY